LQPVAGVTLLRQPGEDSVQRVLVEGRRPTQDPKVLSLGLPYQHPLIFGVQLALSSPLLSDRAPQNRLAFSEPLRACQEA
jgi:hypothetical protein